MKSTIHKSFGLDHCCVLIAGVSLAAAQDRKVGSTWINTEPPTRRRSGNLDVVATIQKRKNSPSH